MGPVGRVILATATGVREKARDRQTHARAHAHTEEYIAIGILKFLHYMEGCTG